MCIHDVHTMKNIHHHNVYTSLLCHGVCPSIVLSVSLNDPSNSPPTPSVMTPAMTVFIQGHHLHCHYHTRISLLMRQ